MYSYTINSQPGSRATDIEGEQFENGVALLLSIGRRCTHKDETESRSDIIEGAYQDVDMWMKLN